jgi:hypothetical protein
MTGLMCGGVLLLLIAIAVVRGALDVRIVTDRRVPVRHPAQTAELAGGAGCIDAAVPAFASLLGAVEAAAAGRDETSCAPWPGAAGAAAGSATVDGAQPTGCEHS